MTTYNEVGSGGAVLGLGLMVGPQNVGGYQSAPAGTFTNVPCPPYNDDISVGTPWTQVDGTWQSTEVGLNYLTNYLEATNFGFNVPDDAVISGIVVFITRTGVPHSMNTTFVDNKISLVVNGDVTVTNYAKSTDWPSGTSQASYGTYGQAPSGGGVFSSDTWNIQLESDITLTPAIVNSSNFGVAIQVNPAVAGTAIIDSVSMWVVYNTVYQQVSQGSWQDGGVVSPFGVAENAPYLAFYFSDVNIPQGSGILQAELGVNQGGGLFGVSSPMTVYVSCENADNSSNLGFTPPISSLPMTVATANSVTVNGENTDDGTENLVFTSLSFTAGLQAVVNRAGWLAGNAIVVILEPSGVPDVWWNTTTLPTLAVTYSQSQLVPDLDNQAIFNVTASGYAICGGTAPLKTFRGVAGSGGAVVSGTAAIQNPVTYYTPAGGLSFSGASPLVTAYRYLPSGGLSFGGAATELVQCKDFSSGGVRFGGHAPARMTFKIPIDLRWNVHGLISLQRTLIWNVGQLQQFWYRVQGTDINNVCNTDCCLTFVVNIQAGSISDLCQQLIDRNFQWPITSVQQFTSLDASNPDDPTQSCNLTPIQVCSNPICATLCLAGNGFVSVGFNVKGALYSVYNYVAEVGQSLSFSGAALTSFTIKPYTQVVVASGGMSFGGSASLVASAWQFTMSGGVQAGGEPILVASHWNFNAGDWPFSQTQSATNAVDIPAPL